MAITTVFNSDRYLTSSIQIVKEWMLDFIIDCDFVDEMPTLDEDYPIERPIIHFRLLPGYDRSVGIGRSIGNNRKAKIYQPEWMINYIITSDLGGTNKVREYSEILKTNIDKNGYLLAKAGLRLPACGGLREFPKDSLSIYYGGRQMISYRVMIEY